MEFEKINPEKSWNLFRDLTYCETNFSHAACAFQVSCTGLCTFYYCTLIFPKLISIKSYRHVIHRWKAGLELNYKDLKRAGAPLLEVRPYWRIYGITIIQDLYDMNVAEIY